MSLLTPRRRSAAAGSEVPVLRVRLAPGVKLRRESTGLIAYVPRRDHFFALDAEHADVARRAGKAGWHRAAPEGQDRLRTLAELGILETEPETPRRAFAGRAVVGRLTELPTSRIPLVVNYFATSFCPLRCTYCHADDLMVDYREHESDRWLARVLRIAGATPSMVGVVTGGEPLARVERTERLITKLVGTGKSVVLDTSGVGDFSRLVPLLKKHHVHVRVSLDSADAVVNDGLRPANRQFLLAGTSSAAHAVDTVRRAVRAGVPCSVQTVVTSRNGDAAGLLALRDELVRLGVTTWVLHTVVAAGKAAAPRKADLLSGAGTHEVLAELVRSTARDEVPIDIRVTSTHRAPNSVLLISAKGEIAVEDVAGAGRKLTYRVPWWSPRRAVLRHFRTRIDRQGHASRYLNGSLEPLANPAGAVLPMA